MKIKGSLLFLCLSALASAQSGTTLLVKTDMGCNWKLDGQSMGMLKADDANVVLVSAGEHLVEAAATDGTAFIRTKVQVDQVEKTVDLRLRSQDGRQPKMQPAEAPRVPATDAAQNQTWTDPATRLMWTAKDNGSDVDWEQATAYCAKYQFAGHSGWRLPTTEELQGIYDPSVSARTLFGHDFTVDVHVNGNLTVTGSTWSGSQGEGLGRPYQAQWFVKLGGLPTSPDMGKPLKNFMHFDWDMRALCVRRPETVERDR